MANQPKRWRFHPLHQDIMERLQHELGISATIARLLVNRGILELADARIFLSGDTTNLFDPFLLKDMAAAVTRIAQAIENQEPITVYGDYDVDGVTACSLLCKTLTRLKARVNYYIPERQSEGYGLNSEALNSLQCSGVTLVITVDCGISSVEEICACKDLLDIIVTDHHQPPAQLPPAYAIINPKQSDCLYPDKDLAGVGVAFKLCQALWRHYHNADALFTDDLDLVAVGTVADIVPLRGENRILVKSGLKQLSDTQNLGLKALKEVCGLTGKTVDSGHVGFAIGPRLNAAGRVNVASAGVELLLTEDAAVAESIARQLDQENTSRQLIEKEILQAAQDQLRSVDVQAAKVLVVFGEGWHSGVIGIVASRLVERYYRPVILISVDQGIGKGSCRSITGFDMVQALTECQDILIKFGGHRQAAGLTIAAENIPALRQRLEGIAGERLAEADYIPELKVDAYLPLQEIRPELLEQLAVLAPHGAGNPAPLFAERALPLADVRTLGQEQKHLKLQLGADFFTEVKDIVAWNIGAMAGEIQNYPAVDLVFSPQYNEWRGKKTIQLQARDLRSATLIPETERPDRTLVGGIYLLLKEFHKASSPTGNLIDGLTKGLQEKYQLKPALSNLLAGLQVLAEVGLLSVQLSEPAEITVQLRPAPPKKLDLCASATFRSGLMEPGALFDASRSVKIKESNDDA
ncbi:MAG TPA: single-stranded-DNA-specific exonuclease RecJ [Patescibacteria group bacterium]|nr:single-stranded-DNA-specific exonuclease RecJ [Patescibacteria group bacterium]